MRGKPIDGWLRVDADGVTTKRQLERWVMRGVTYARRSRPGADAGRRRRPTAGQATRTAQAGGACTTISTLASWSRSQNIGGTGSP